MKMIFTGKVSGEKTVLAAGARHTVKAQAGEQYGLVDEVTGLVPDGVEADRSGDDLILRKKEDSTEVRIEGFWEECQPGETQCTAVFNVVGENGQVTEAVLTQDGPVLENFTAGQSGTLAGGINNGIIWGGIAFGAGLAAIALAAGGGGGSSRHKRTAEGEQKPLQPDGNGKADAEEAAVAAATAAVEAAEAADQAAKDKLAELNADNLITPEEKAQLEAAKQNADTLKGEADSAVKALPDTAAEKGGLQDRVDALDGIQVPEVNDQDGNGKADAEEAAVAAATAAVEAAEAADQAAKDKLAELNADNLITPEEKAQLEAAKQNADTLKGEADSAVKALPDTAAEKGGLQDRVDALDGIQVPEVNDQDGNGKADAEEAAVAAATAAVEAAEAADQAAKDKLAELNADNLITPEEKAQLEAAKQNADTLKGEADSAVKALPDTAAEKGGLQDRVDALDGIQVPEVNDQDGNGKADAEEAAVAAATAAVEAAEAADQAAKDKLAELNADNLITPEEKAQLEAAKQNADTLKGEADSAVKALPDTAAEKGGLQDRVDALDGIQVPEVNDQDGNGKADAEEAAVAAATAAVEAAEAADQAAKDKLAELNADNLITPEEKAQLEAAKQNADTLKGEADSAVKALPDTAAEKGGLQDRVDALDGIQVPEVNDQDGNGKADAEEAAVAAATAAVEAAEAADQAAKDKLAELNADNLITPEEKAQLEAAKQNADTLKGEADSAVKALPDTAAEKGGLQDRVDALDGIQVPEVNDQDGNGKADAEEAAVAAATAAVEAAEAADQAAKDKLAELNADNLITPEEKAQLEAAKQNADTLKGEADSAVKALPDTAAEKGGLQDRVDALDGIQVPEVNDQDGNGKADAEEAAVAAATAAVEAAEAADQAAKDKLAELNADNLITPEEKAQLEAAKQNADTLKGEADSAVKALPDTAAEKGGLQDRVDALDGIQVPEVNDQDGNGKADAEEAAVAAATAAVEAAEAADQAAKDKLAELNADNLITPEEKAQLEAAKQNADTLKGEADSAVKALPDTAAEKGGLQDRVDALDGIQVPEVNDQDGNGKADAEEAAFNNAKAHLEKALNTVYQPNDDLYAVYKSAFNKPTGNPEASTTSWREVLNQNGVSGFSVDKGHDAAYRYTYNGLDGDDVISTAYSVGGTGRSMVSRNDMVINTNGGDDIISVGMDYGRSYSAGYTDKKYATNTGAGDDIMMIGLGNNKVGVHLRDDLSLRIVDRDDTINNGELLLPVSQYDKGTGGIISSTSINMGDGNDTLLAFGYEGFGKAIVNTNIDLGAGNDIIHVNGDVEAVNIKGGEGMDTLAISHGTLSTTDFSGFEVIELGDNNGGINVIASALVHSGVDAIEGGILKITGTSNARVNLDGNDWKSGGVLSEDGVNYNVYTHDAAPDIKILIDEHITNVV